MRSIGKADKSGGGLAQAVAEFADTLLMLGRNRPLRDPIAMAVEEAQFTPAQIHSLMWLGTDGDLTMGVLAQRVGITEKTITGVVDRLEREEYLQRVRSETDRRVVHVRLTRKGQGVYKRFDVDFRKHLGEFLSLMDEDDRCSVLRIFRCLVDRISQPKDDPKDAPAHGKKER